ncbi:MAG: hypothetical protein K1X75_03065 [Leptospirales bacterium]|nr:hypothetical protein [Leptospirales bacterium]
MLDWRARRRSQLNQSFLFSSAEYRLEFFRPRRRWILLRLGLAALGFALLEVASPLAARGLEILYATLQFSEVFQIDPPGAWLTLWAARLILALLYASFVAPVVAGEISCWRLCVCLVAQRQELFLFDGGFLRRRLQSLRLQDVQRRSVTQTWLQRWLKEGDVTLQCDGFLYQLRRIYQPGELLRRLQP